MKKEIIKPLQTIRFACFMMIFLYHTYFLCNILDGYYASRAVSFFVLLSGFFMYYQYYDKIISFNIKEFLKFVLNKIKKFYPLFLISSILPFIWYFGEKSFNFFKISKYLLLLQVYFPSGFFDFNGVAWFLSLTICLYLCSYIIFKIFKKLNIKKCIILIIFIFILMILWNKLIIYKSLDEEYFAYICPIPRIFEFYLGCLLSFFVLNIKGNDFYDKFKNKKIIWTILELLTIYIFINSLLKRVLVSPVYNRQLIHVPYNLLLLLIFYFQNGMISKIFSNKLLVYFGNISFNLYIIHQVIITFVCGHNVLNLQGRYLVIFIFIIVIVSAIFYDLLSKRVRKLILKK